MGRTDYHFGGLLSLASAQTKPEPSSACISNPQSRHKLWRCYADTWCTGDQALTVTTGQRLSVLLPGYGKSLFEQFVAGRLRPATKGSNSLLEYSAQRELYRSEPDSV